MRKSLLIIVSLLFSASLFAQIEQNYSFREFNRVKYNPASVGSSPFGNITLIGRHQYLNESDATELGMLNIDGAMGKYSGMGASIVYDRNNPDDYYSAVLNYAIHIPIAERHHLSIGIGGGVNIGRHGMKNWNLVPIINAGIEYRLKGWTLGASINDIEAFFLKPFSFKELDDSYSLLAPAVSYNVYTNYKFEVARYWNITPAIAGYYDGIRAYEEIGIVFEYTRAIWFGAKYRMYNLFLAESVVPTIGFNITDFMQLGYAYEYCLSGEHNNPLGTHELYLNLRFRTKGRSNYIPRFTDWD